MRYMTGAGLGLVLALGAGSAGADLVPTSEGVYVVAEGGAELALVELTAQPYDLTVGILDPGGTVVPQAAALIVNDARLAKKKLSVYRLVPRTVGEQRRKIWRAETIRLTAVATPVAGGDGAIQLVLRDGWPAGPYCLFPFPPDPGGEMIIYPFVVGEADTLRHRRAATAEVEKAAYELGRENFDGAVRHLDAAVKRDPSWAGALAFRGSANLSRGQYAAAAADFEQAIALRLQAPSVYQGRGTARLGMGEFDGALADFGQAIALDPDEAGAYAERARARADMGDYAPAMLDCEKAKTLDPNAAWVHTACAYVLLGRDDFDGAVAACDAAIAVNWRLTPAYVLRGWAELGRQGYDRAARNFARALDLEAGNVLAHLGLADAYVGQEQFDHAQEAYRAATEAARTDDERAQVHAGMAELARRQGNLDAALELAEQAVTQGSGIAAAYAVRGEVKLDRGDTAGAKADLTAALDKLPADPAARAKAHAALQRLR